VIHSPLEIFLLHEFGKQDQSILITIVSQFAIYLGAGSNSFNGQAVPVIKTTAAEAAPPTAA